ncbi:MAG TPA: dihydropteroate synthase [Candidatus Nanopelagicaceae bacterium]|nr:dihydropteroate synthase [Candidatus Nanopelagicaceae bacterium]
MSVPPAESSEVRLLATGQGPGGPWARLLLPGPVDPTVWPDVLPPGVQLENPGREPVVTGTLAELATLGLRLGASGRAVANAARALLRPPPPLRLGSARWEFGRRTYLLGVLNVTPDSFSGDGVGGSLGAARERARQLVAEGVDAIDVGGESTRPGHQMVPPNEELRRVVPVLEMLADEFSVPLFVDTTKAVVARAALAAGAVAVNDVWGLRGDPEMAAVVAAADAAVVCMHNQQGVTYRDLRGEVLAGLRESQRLAVEAGIPADRVLVDPGFGFGKTPQQSLELLTHLEEFRVLGRPLLVGTSRKSMVGWMLDNRPVGGRLLGTAATVAWAASRGADVVRVHDVAAMRDVTRVIDRLARHRSD